MLLRSSSGRPAASSRRSSTRGGFPPDSITVHSPRLEDAGFVTVEGDSVALTERGSALEPYLALTE
ncbi:hypothetical protein [Haladaptatus salinisoli]|uniref:hypothetical protein n=1 Tax=Haladaptatus salinisoli TaxID=2884876 RepID=UPI001D0B653B|nr:hypothetical protein [Haladaptatus salinisoli]